MHNYFYLWAKRLSRTTPMKIKLGAKSFWQGIVHTMDMLLATKELFLKLTVPKKEAKCLQTTSCGIVNKNMLIQFAEAFIKITQLSLFSNFRSTIFLRTPNSECFSLCLYFTPKKNSQVWVHKMSYQLVIN